MQICLYTVSNVFWILCHIHLNKKKKKQNPIGTTLDFLLASGRRTYISIHDLKFPELSPQLLCNNNSYTRPWK